MTKKEAEKIFIEEGFPAFIAKMAANGVSEDTTEESLRRNISRLRSMVKK